MRTVLNRSTGRASFILVSAGMVGSVALSVVPAGALAANHHSPAGISWHAATHRTHHHGSTDGNVKLGPAVAFVRGSNGVVHRIR